MEDHRAEYLVEQYSDMILRLGFSWLGDMDDAMDICQEVLLKLLTDQRTFPDQGQERAWVVRLAINQCKNWKKSAWFQHRGGTGAGRRTPAGADPSSPAQIPPGNLSAIL